MRPLILFGGGGHCVSCIDVIENQKKYKIIGIIDKKKDVDNILGYPILGDDKYINNKLTKDIGVLICIGQIKTSLPRIKLFNKLLKKDALFATIISLNAYISKHSSIGFGSIVMHGVNINAGVKINKNCIINTGTLIEHGASIGNHCHVSTGVKINGDANIGDEVFIGSGSVIFEGISIKSGSVIPAGTIVKKNM